MNIKLGWRTHARIWLWGNAAWIVVSAPTLVVVSVQGYWWGWMVTLPVGLLSGHVAFIVAFHQYGRAMVKATEKVEAENPKVDPMPVNVRLEGEGGEKISLELRPLGRDPFGGVGWGAEISRETFQRYEADELMLAADESPAGTSITLISPDGGITAIPRPEGL